ncbi:unnamed protein product, partial [Iphiclides podalirius]
MRHVKHWSRYNRGRPRQPHDASRVTRKRPSATRLSQVAFDPGVNDYIAANFEAESNQRRPARSGIPTDTASVEASQ